MSSETKQEKFNRDYLKGMEISTYYDNQEDWREGFAEGFAVALNPAQPKRVND